MVRWTRSCPRTGGALRAIRNIFRSKDGATRLKCRSATLGSTRAARRAGKTRDERGDAERDRHEGERDRIDDLDAGVDEERAQAESRDRAEDQPEDQPLYTGMKRRKTSSARWWRWLRRAPSSCPPRASAARRCATGRRRGRPSPGPVSARRAPWPAASAAMRQETDPRATSTPRPRSRWRDQDSRDAAMPHTEMIAEETAVASWEILFFAVLARTCSMAESYSSRNSGVKRAAATSTSWSKVSW